MFLHGTLDTQKLKFRVSRYIIVPPLPIVLILKVNVEGRRPIYVYNGSQKRVKFICSFESESHSYLCYLQFKPLKKFLFKMEFHFSHSNEAGFYILYTN